MLAFAPLSSAALSALPDYLTTPPGGAFTGSVIYEAVATSAYMQFVSGSNERIAYTVEISLRAVR
jgi:hypothetical protein